jgi:hypothetical protein
MRRVSELLRDYRNGDRLTDDELECLETYMNTAADALLDLGDLFVLPQAYARKVAMDCRSFLNARNERLERNSRSSKAAGGEARAAKLSPERRTEIAKKAADTRWKGD